MIDFGAAEIHASSTPVRGIAGTIQFCCPESFVAPQYYGKPADIWALGVLLFVMINGYYPFDSSFKDLEWGNIEKNKHAKDLLSKIFNQNPKTRINISELAIHPWFN